MAPSNRSSASLHYAKYPEGAVFSALFRACVVLLGLASTPALATSCPPHKVTETATVRHVHDGDTLWLEDGRKLRLIGIDTPELARKQQPAQAYSQQARSALIKLLRTSENRIGISYGTQRKDRYQRTLAHLYLPDGQSVQAYLLANGYATAFTTPPNDSRSDCYRQAEASAIQQRLGIWSLPKYQLKTIHQLNKRHRGFTRVEAQVTDIRFAKKAVWIEAGARLKLRIDNRDLHYFNLYSLQNLRGKTIQVRGWMHPKKDHLFMALRHGDALIIK